MGIQLLYVYWIEYEGGLADNLEDVAAGSLRKQDVQFLWVVFLILGYLFLASSFMCVCIT